MAEKKYTPTPEQDNAIDHPHDKPAIVAAAAGSGKTTLLVDRVVRLLSDTKLNISADSLAIMTFTRNATKSMREKLSQKLNKKLEELADSTGENNREIHDYLKKQIFLLRQASISTIDAFCLRMIKENAEAFDLPLNFTLADSAKKAAMQLQAMNAALEELFSDSFSDEERSALFFSFSFENDYALEKALLSVEDKLSCFPDPEKWMSDTLDAYKDLKSLEENYLGLLDDFLEYNINKANIYTAKYSDEHIYDSIRRFVDEKRKLVADINDEEDETAKKVTTMDEMLPKIQERIEVDEKLVETLVNDYNKYKSSKTVENLAALMTNLDENVKKQPSFSLNKGFVCDGKSRFKVSRDEIDAAVKKLLECKVDLSEAQNEPGLTQSSLRTFFKLLNIYREYYTLEKRSAGCIDFSDCERELYNKLSENGGDNDFRRQLAKRFSCVIVDEFQDCNNIQAEIFRLLGEKRLFYVGDVKQSIYSFRGADPYIMAELCDNKESDFKTLLLNTNFRSRKAVVDTVNAAFKGLMTTRFGGVDYNDDSKLHMGADYPDYEKPENSALYDSELTYILPSSKEGDVEKDMTLPRYVAQRIRDLVNNEDFLVCDGKDENDNYLKRRAEYSDFIVLLRTSSKINNYRKALAELGIPSSSKSGSGFFNADEIKLAINFLKIIDDPLSNEEYLKVMMSPIYRFTAEETAQIKMGLLGIEEIQEIEETEEAEEVDEAEEYEEVEGSEKTEEAEKTVTFEKIEKTDKKKLKKIADSYKWRSLFSCVNDCMTQNVRYGNKKIRVKRKIYPKLERFVKDLKAFRYHMGASSLVDLVRKVYEDTDLISIVASFEDSARRVGNIRQLQRMAEGFESRGGGGLGDFLRFLDRAAENASKGVEEAAQPDSGENSVRIMTFHASKGLEAPVCIMSELQGEMNKNDYTKNLLISYEHFMAMAHTNVKRRKKSKLTAYRAFSKFIRDRRLGDELRLLYVAMTRAQEKLIMVSEIIDDNYKKFAGFINGERPSDVAELHDEIYEGAMPFKCVLRSLLKDAPALDDKAKEFSFVNFACKVSAIDPNAKPKVEEKAEKAADGTEAPIEKNEKTEKPEEAKKIPEEEIAALSALINGKYAYPEDTVQQAKYTTTELAHKKDAKPISLTKPAFASDGAVSGVEKGNAYHHCMQHFPLGAVSPDMDKEALLSAVREALDVMEKSRKITSDELKIIEPERIAAFFECDLGKRMLRTYQKNPENVKREQSFYAEVNGSEVRQEYGGEISIQGQIDMYFIEDGDIVVVDYKSDTIANLAKERSSYEFQVEIYTKVLGKLTGMNVKEMYLYAFLADSEYKI